MKNYSALAFLIGLFCSAVYFFSIPRTFQQVSNFVEVSFSKLDGWENDAHEEALRAFQNSCERIMSYPEGRPFNAFGEAADWKPVCNAASEINNFNRDQARNFFEYHFRPVAYRNEPSGLFTGYYAPLYKGSRQKKEKYNFPLYAIPEDLQSINLGDFDLSLRGRSIVGEVKNDKFIPYKNRKEIDLGALEGQDLELVWLEKAAETFFLQIQGSGFIELEDGEIVHLGFAQKNGRPYRAIGQYLIENGDIKREDMSLQAILKWMDDNPEETFDLMWKNPSYVFFQERTSAEPIGSLGIGLTPGRSLAVDRDHIPLGMPLWLETYEEIETDAENIEARPNLKRLVIAQDTGGAIKGKVRGDVYWGIGEEAERKAGPMKDGGTYYLLVPNPVVSDFESPS